MGGGHSGTLPRRPGPAPRRPAGPLGRGPRGGRLPGGGPGTAAVLSPQAAMDLEAGRNGTARRPRTGGDLELSSSRYSPAGTRSRYARAGRGRESTKPAGCLGLGLGAPVGGSRLRSGPFPRNVPAAPGAAGGLGKGLSFQAPASLCQCDSGNISCITILVLYNSKLLQTTFVNIICFFMLIEHRTFAADGCAFRSRAGKPLPRLPLLRPLPPRLTPSPSSQSRAGSAFLCPGP